VARWDLDFDVALDDEQLARDCFRILRRTRVRFYLDFSYYEQRRNQQRIVFVLGFDATTARACVRRLRPRDACRFHASADASQAETAFSARALGHLLRL